MASLSQYKRTETTAHLTKRREVAANIVEGEPHFEDEKIRLWRMSKDAPDRPDVSDETVLALDLETEEIFESRVYPLLLHPATFTLFIRQWLRLEGHPSDPEALLEAVESVVEQSSLKVLAKRNRTDGRISYVVAAAGAETRTLVDRGEAEDEAAYRRAVEELEEELRSPGVVGDPTVTGPEEWRKYEQMSEEES